MSQPLLYRRVKLLRTLKRKDGGVLVERGQVLMVGVQYDKRLALYDHTKTRSRFAPRWVVVNAPADAVEVVDTEPDSP